MAVVRPHLPKLTAFVAAASALLAAGPLAAQEPANLPDLDAYPGLENITLSYDSLRIVGTVFEMRGDIDLVDRANDVRLLADQLSFDVDTLAFEASGNVSFEQGEMLLNGSSMSGDLDAGTMQMDDAIGVAPGPFYVRAERIAQLEPGKFDVENGVVTPCNQTTAIWEFRSGSMTFEPGKYVKMAWPHVRVKGIPVFGLPWVYWPLQDSNRQTGLLMPAVGTSTRKGFMFSESFFWAINRSMDLLLTYENFSNAGSGFGGEFTHALGEGSAGNLRAYYLPGREITPEQAAEGQSSFASGFLVTGSHLQALPRGFVLRANANLISSTQFLRDFQDDVDRFLQRQSLVAADVSKSWGSSTLTMVGDHRENFIGTSGSFIGRRLPQIKYTLRSSQVAGPLYVALQASAARFQKFRVTLDNSGDEIREGGAYGRLDAFPEMSVQLTQIPWLTFQPFFRWRTTYWDSRQGPRDEFAFVREPLTRHFYETGVEVVGPQLFKIFEAPGSEYSPRYKHVIQPRLVYRRVRQLESEFLRRVIEFDEVDSRVIDRQDLIAEVTTRFFAKRYLNPRDDQRQVWQVFEFTVGRSFDLDPLDDELLESLGAPRVQLPWFVRTIVQPTATLYLQSNLSLTPSLEPANISLSSRVLHSLGYFNVTWFRGVRNFLDPLDPATVLVETSSHSLRADSSLDVFGRSLTLGGGVSMDLLQSKIQNVNGSLQWNLQCCSIGVDVRRFNFAGRQETQFGLVLDLAQVGSVGFDNQRR